MAGKYFIFMGIFYKSENESANEYFEEITLRVDKYDLEMYVSISRKKQIEKKNCKKLLALGPIKSVIRPRANKKYYWPGSFVIFLVSRKNYCFT